MPVGTIDIRVLQIAEEEGEVKILEAPASPAVRPYLGYV